MGNQASPRRTVPAATTPTLGPVRGAWRPTVPCSLPLPRDRRRPLAARQRRPSRRACPKPGSRGSPARRHGSNNRCHVGRAGSPARIQRGSRRWRGQPASPTTRRRSRRSRPATGGRSVHRRRLGTRGMPHPERGRRRHRGAPCAHGAINAPRTQLRETQGRSRPATSRWTPRQTARELGVIEAQFGPPSLESWRPPTRGERFDR